MHVALILISFVCFLSGIVIGIYCPRVDAREVADALRENSKLASELRAEIGKTRVAFSPLREPCKKCGGTGAIVHENPLVKAIREAAAKP